MLNDLQAELSKLYPMMDDARRVVDDADIPHVFIEFDGPISNVWHRIVRQAEIRRKLAGLLRVAIEDYPQSVTLQRIYGSLLYMRLHMRFDAPDKEERGSLVASDDSKIDEIYRLVFETRERVSVLRTWLAALTIMVVMAVVLGAWRLF